MKATRRFAVALVIGIACVISGVLFAPTIACRTSLRHFLIRKCVPEEIEAKCESISVGWFAPLRITGIDLRQTDGEWSVNADQANGSRTLLQLILNTQDLGTLNIDRPTICIYTAAIDNEQNSADPEREIDESIESSKNCNLRITITDATIRIGDTPDQRLLSIEKIYLTADYVQTQESRIIEIHPSRPIDRADLTPELCDRGLKYIAPILASVAWTDGRFSLTLSTCKIRLDQPDKSTVVGTLGIHSVRAGAKDGIVRRIVEVVNTSRQRDLATTIQLANESLVEFEIRDGLVKHRGLEFGFPKVSSELLITTQGEVGLIDKSLNLDATIPLPLHLLGDGPIAAALGSQQLTLPIRGTLDEPKVELKGDGQLVSELISKLGNPLVSGDVKLPDILSELRKRRDENRETREQRPGLLQRLRDRRTRGIPRN